MPLRHTIASSAQAPQHSRNGLTVSRMHLHMVSVGYAHRVLPTSCFALPQREAFWNFTEPYLSIPIVIFTRTDVTYIAAMEELKGKKIAATQKIPPRILTLSWPCHPGLKTINETRNSLVKLSKVAK